MLSINTILGLLLGILVMSFLFSVIFKFFGVEFGAYGSYFLWIIALAIFYIVLPQ